MSRFIDELNQVVGSAPQPMGFGVAQSARTKKKMLLVASLAEDNVATLASGAAGADAGLLHIASLSPEAQAWQKAAQTVSGIPWGLWWEDTSEAEITKIVAAGSDFVAFPVSTSLAILQDDKVGKILQVEPSSSDGWLRAINGLPVDAVLVDGGQEKDHCLTWSHLIFWRRLASLLTKPVLVSVPSAITVPELQALGEAGVAGIVVAVTAGQPKGRLKELRQTIDKLTFRSRPQGGKLEALLPQISGESSIAEEDEDEEE